MCILRLKNVKSGTGKNSVGSWQTALLKTGEAHFSFAMKIIEEKESRMLKLGANFFDFC
jgi:hypothetical protein